jgi:PKD repeat protein
MAKRRILQAVWPRVVFGLLLVVAANAVPQDSPATNPKAARGERLGPPFRQVSDRAERKGLLEAWKEKRARERGVVTPLGIPPPPVGIVGRASMVINSANKTSYTKVFLGTGATCDPNIESLNFWQLDNSYSAGDVVRPAGFFPAPNGFDGFNFIANNGGLSGLTEPTWPKAIGATVNDNGIIWRAIAFDPTYFVGCTPMQMISRTLGAVETVIASEGDVVAGTSGAELGGWNEFHAMNSSGLVAFRAALAGWPFNDREDEGESAIVTAGPGAGAVKKIAATGEIVGGRKFCGFSAMVGMNNAGQIIFDGLATTVANSCDENNHALIRFTPGPGNQLLVEQGSTVGGAKVIGFGNDDNSTGSCSGCEYNNIDGFINSSGHVPVVLNLDDGSQGVFIFKAPGSVTQVARTGVGGITAIRPRVVINDSDQVSFQATSGGVDRIFRFTPPSTLATVASVGDIINGEKIQDFGPFTDINNLGNIVFEADLVPNSNAPQGYYFWDGTVTEILLVPNGNSLASEMITVNDSDLVAYVTGNQPPEGTDDASEMSQTGGLFFWTKAGGSVNAISKGDIIGGNSVQTIYAQHPSFARRQLSEGNCVATEYAVTSDDPDLDDTEGVVLSPGGQLFVSCGCGTITLSPATLPGGTVGLPYNQTITASGGASPFTFTVTSGSLPSGLNLASNGLLSGTPDTNGSFPFTITATDANDCTGSQAYTIVIAPCVAPAAPTLSINPASATVGQLVQLSWNSTLSAGQGKYLVQESTGGGPFSTIGTVNASNAPTASFSFFAAAPTGTQSFQVVAVPTCDSKLAAASNVVTLDVSGSITPPPCNPPAPPAGLTVSPSPATPGATFTLSWQPVSGADHYNILVSTDGGATFSSLGFVYGTQFQGTVNGSPGTTLTFAVQAVAICGTASANSTVTLPVGTACEAPGRVSKIKIQAFGVSPARPPSPTEYILISWSAPQSGTIPTRYGVRINGDPEVIVVGTSVVLQPRGTADPITAFVRAFGCAPLTSAETFDPATKTWSVTGNLALPREEHTASLLADGNVLVAGGAPNLFTAPTPTAEVFNFTTGQWSSTGPLAEARAQHGATGLAGSQATSTSGARTLAVSQGSQVLVEGGVGTEPLSSAELYDSAAGTWSTVGALANARDLHSTTLLSDGRVLVAGGLASGPLSSAEIYDPATKAWTATGTLATARYRHTATLLSNGKVLVAGGFGAAGALASAELYDPAAGTWTSTGSLATARQGHAAVLLLVAGGKAFVTGGDDGSVPLASAELYDPATGMWAATGSLITARRNHTATRLADGKALIVGGFGADLTTSLKSAELYDPATGTFSATDLLKGAHGIHTATLLNTGKVLAAGTADSLGTELAGSTDNSEVVALFLSPPVASFTISANPQVGAPVTFTDTSSPQATSWLWIFDDGTADDPDPAKRPTSTLQSPVHIFASAGTHQVTLVVSNGAGSSTATQSFTVAAAGGALRIVPSQTISFDMRDPGRRRARVEVAGSNAVFLQLTSRDTSETIVFLRFLDPGGRLVAERRLSVQPGAPALFDLGAYGFTGRFSIELVSDQKFESTLSVKGRPSVREIHR